MLGGSQSPGTFISRNIENARSQFNNQDLPTQSCVWFKALEEKKYLSHSSEPWVGVFSDFGQ